MFENIIAQSEAVETLAREIKAGAFPRAALFFGPAFSGKLSTALETARVLTCERAGEWSCECPPCAQHRLLLHPYTVLAGPRQVLPELRAARDAFERTGSVAARFLYLRAARKLARRFDPHVFQPEDNKRREIQETLLGLEEALGAFEPDRPKPEGKTGEKIYAGVEELCAKLEGWLPKENIPIAVIRNITQWANFTAPSAKKIVILENASRLLDASRNALLKALEEPPADTHFILLAERRDELIPTIRSRLRAYCFRERRPEEARAILQRVFKEDNPEYESLRGYFLAWEDIHLDAVRSLARRFAEKILASEPVVIRDEIPELFKKENPRAFYRYFLEELVGVFGDWLAGDAFAGGEIAADRPRPPLARLEAWAGLVRERAREFFTLNIASALFIEGLFLSLKETA